MFGSPPGPPRPGGQPSYVNAQGQVFAPVPGMGIQPVTRFGLPVTAVGIGGLPQLAPSIGPRQPARTPGGLPITGPGGQPLFNRPPGGFPH